MPYSLRSVSRRFSGRGAPFCALDRISLDLEPGELVAIAGASGCGKTTLLQILGAMDPGYEGEVLFRGRNLRRLSESQRAFLRLSSVGFVFQSHQLIDALTVHQNVALPYWRLHGDRRRAEAKARELAAQLDLEGLLHRRPAELSTGEMQRAGVARALICEPEVVLADEPTASLDVANSRYIVAALQAISKTGRTIILTSHDAAVVASAHRVLRIDHGRLVSDSGQPEPLSDDAQVAFAMGGSAEGRDHRA